jgi:hypothetical protein
MGKVSATLIARLKAKKSSLSLGESKDAGPQAKTVRAGRINPEVIKSVKAGKKKGSDQGFF